MSTENKDAWIEKKLKAGSWVGKEDAARFFGIDNFGCSQIRQQAIDPMLVQEVYDGKLDHSDLTSREKLDVACQLYKMSFDPELAYNGNLDRIDLMRRELNKKFGIAEPVHDNLLEKNKARKIASELAVSVKIETSCHPFGDDGFDIVRPNCDGIMSFEAGILSGAIMRSFAHDSGVVYMHG